MKKIVLFVISALLIGCQHAVTDPEMVNEKPSIYPDYVGVTIPAEIAPLDFNSQEPDLDWMDVIVRGAKGGELHSSGKSAAFSIEDWQELLKKNKGDSLSVTVAVQKNGKWKQYRSFAIYVSPNALGEYGLVYRRIAPGYEVYSKMGIYERELGSFKERPILENTVVPGMCVNCHSFNQTDPNYLSLHVRGAHGATLMQINGQYELLNTKVDSMLSACVYPYWHPSGKYIAYSVNTTRQGFHAVKNERIEVLDLASDVLVYHPQTHELLVSPLLQRKDVFETFPVFSPDGKKLYFCAAAAKEVPDEYQDIHYDLCSIDFDPETGLYGERVDTLIHASQQHKSVSFPRPSYDGKYIMFTMSDYGNFSIWHKEADLWMLNLEDHSVRPLDKVNSDDTESFHNWSSNSKWFVFSSRRDDGLYTRLYIAGLDEKGNVTKPFMLPQENPLAYYNELMYSYNVPDFVRSPLDIQAEKIGKQLMTPARTNLKLKRQTAH